MKTMVDDAKSSRQKALKKEVYQRFDKEVKSSLRKDKREWANTCNIILLKKQKMLQDKDR